MSGILESKSRMIDAILTVEGRRQMAEGTYEVSYVTFTDSDVAYDYDPVEGHVDPTGRIYLEVCNLPQDQITFEANDSGKLRPFRSADIVITSPGNFPDPTSQAVLSEGKLVAYQKFHGRKVKVSSIFEDQNDLNKGFSYSDSTLLTASILIDPFADAGTIVGKFSPPFKATIGTKGGLSERKFASAISKAISLITDNSGPSINPTVAEDTVYLDIGYDLKNATLSEIGTLSSPLFLDQQQVGNKLISSEVESAAFASQIRGILTSSFDNFLELQTIATVDPIFEDKEFKLSTDEISFDVNNLKDVVSKNSAKFPPTTNEINSIFSDDKLSHLDNFLYLPPIIKTSDTLFPDKTNIEALKTGQRFLGDYPSWGDNESKLTFSKIKNQILNFGNIGSEVFFAKSSIKNNIIGQIFEISNGSVNKLDIVDFGHVYNDQKKIQEKIYFVGKVFLDNRGTTCFVNMFTLIFTSEEGGL